MKLTPLITQLSILDKDLRVSRLNPNWAQREYLALAERQLTTTGRIRIIVLKARQLGISTITEALLFTLAFTFENYKAMVIAHEVPASQNLLAMTNRYWMTYPFHDAFSTKFQGKNQLQWNETGSSILVATAGNKAVGRSATIHAVHASEVAFWPDPEVAMLGLRQTIPSTPGTVIVLESTANGMGNYFHAEWEAAEAGDSEFETLFFPWHRHPEYTASAIGLPYHSLGQLDEEEKALVAMGISDDRLAWRRWAIRNLCQNDLLKFKQEYPATPDEAFIASGTNVFPAPKLNAVYEPQPGMRGQLIEDATRVRFIPRDDGPLTIYKAPNRNTDLGRYVVAGDPTRTTQGDFACVQVINRRTLEQVAEWRGRIDPVSFADVIFMLGRYYNNALVSTEIEGPGYSTIGALLTKNYPHVFARSRPDNLKPPTDSYGWSTTMQTKNQMIGWLLRAVVDESIKIHSKTLYGEMKNYVTLNGGGYGPSDSKGFDDTVMAMAQAITVNMIEPPIAAYGEESQLASMGLKTAPQAVQEYREQEPPWADWPAEHH